MKKVNKVIFITFLTSLLSISLASAHERQVMTIGGKDYLFVVGSLNESVVVGDKTGIDLRIYLSDPKDIGSSSATNSKPVLGLEKTLKVENISGSSKKEFPLSASWGKDGNYQTLFYPSNSDTLSYRIFGNIDGKNVDLLFICNQAGHVMGEMSGGAIHMKNGDFDVKFHAGSFGCPKEKAGYIFPPIPQHSLKDKVMDNLLGIIALLLVLGFIVQSRKNRR